MDGEEGHDGQILSVKQVVCMWMIWYAIIISIAMDVCIGTVVTGGLEFYLPPIGDPPAS